MIFYLQIKIKAVISNLLFQQCEKSPEHLQLAKSSNIKKITKSANWHIS